MCSSISMSDSIISSSKRFGRNIRVVFRSSCINTCISSENSSRNSITSFRSSTIVEK